MSGALYAMPRNLVLAASAGTGKTHALVGVVVHLVIGGRPGGAVDPARIVATTFSRKAAAEIRGRVVSEIERLAVEPAGSVYVSGLRETIGPRATDAELAKRARRVLTRLPHARFGTLHSFATGIVQRYAVELGLGPRFELASDVDSRARADEAIAAALSARLGDGAAVLRALAEAAGGIDRLVSSLRRVLVQLEEDGRSARDLAIDASDAAIVEARMRELLFHARAIASHPPAEAAARELAAAWDAGDEERVEEAVASLTALSARGKKPPEVESFFAFRNDLPGAKNEEKGRRLAGAWRARHEFRRHATLARDILADAESELERSGRARATLGFGEVLRAARELLRERPDVADEIGSGIEALLVDEFQDTSRVQRDLLQLLWARPEARPKAGHVPPLSAMRPRGLLVVGDRKQSIYGFRGADVGVFAELAVGLAGAPAREALGIPVGVTWEPKEPMADFHALRHNRRSVSSILAFANAFSARRFQPGEPPPELFEIEYVSETEDLLVPPSLSAVSSTSPATTWLRVTPKGGASTRLEEALVIAAKVESLVGSGEANLRDVAVLATTNGMLDAAAFALAQVDIPYVVAGKGFFRAREISDLAAMLALVLEPTDRLAMLEVLRGPWAGVHDETLLGLVEPGRGIVPPSSWEAPPEPRLVREEDRRALAVVASLVGSLSRCSGRLGAGAILREAIAQCALEPVLAAMPRGQQRLANVEKLLAMADRHPDARAFRAWLDEAKEQEVAESEAATFSEDDDAVRLLTVHASKGLDFPIVFIPEIGAGLPRTEKGVARVAIAAGDGANVLSVRIADENGLVLDPPSYLHAYANARRRERAERQRLAYVAVTRAAHAMYLVGGRSRDTALDPGSSTLAVVEMLAAEAPALLAVEDVAVPERHAVPVHVVSAAAIGPAPDAPARIPEWSVLPIAPTALADFDHCARRFQLVHLLGLPEHVRGRRSPEMPAADDERTDRAHVALDTAEAGTVAHAVLELLSVEAFLDPQRAGPEIARLLAGEGVPEEHPQHTAISARAMRFLGTAYARSIAEGDGRIAREVAFVLPVDDGAGRAVSLRGSMDLVVTWPDGGVDVVDYKSARRGDTDGYAFQLDVYALAAHARFPGATRLRAGLAFLGAGTGEPVWRDLPDERTVRAHIAGLGAGLVRARWNETFPRVAIDRCESIHCGFIGRCHPRRDA